jgi:hypothetical protein
MNRWHYVYMHNRMQKKGEVLSYIQKGIRHKKFKPNMRFHLVENFCVLGEEEKLLTIERISSMYSKEVLVLIEETDWEKSIKRNWRQYQRRDIENAASKQDHRVITFSYRLYRHPESTDSNQFRHFIYCIMPEVASRDTTICVLYLMQRKIIDSKDTELSYEYVSSLLYMKLPSYRRIDKDGFFDNEDNITSLDTDLKKKIIQLVKYRNKCFKNIRNNTFHEGRLMERPVRLSSDYKAYIAVHQSVAPPYLLSVSLRDEDNNKVGSIACICAIL